MSKRFIDSDEPLKLKGVASIFNETVTIRSTKLDKDFKFENIEALCKFLEDAQNLKEKNIVLENEKKGLEARMAKMHTRMLQLQEKAWKYDDLCD